MRIGEAVVQLQALRHPKGHDLQEERLRKRS